MLAIIIFICMIIGSVQQFMDGVVHRDRDAMRNAFVIWGLVLLVVLWHFLMVANHIPEPSSAQEYPFGYDTGGDDRE